MNIQIAVLCDAAADYNGKLNILGAFDTIITPQLPAEHPQCSVAMRFTYMSQDEGQHRLRLAFVDADGRNIMPPIDIPVNVQLPEDSHFVTSNYVVNIQRLRLNQAGLFSIDAFLDDSLVISMPLLVKLREPQQPPTTGDEWKTQGS
jgi:hypothetical protein